jgi:hypothetical protein
MMSLSIWQKLAARMIGSTVFSAAALAVGFDVASAMKFSPGQRTLPSEVPAACVLDERQE